MSLVAKTLNLVGSVGEERAALQAAAGELERGLDEVHLLSTYSVPTPEEAQNTLAIYKGEVAGELAALASSAEDSAVDPDNWPRARRAIERSYIEVAGVDGTVGSLLDTRIDSPGILADAVANAPKVFLQAAGTAAGEVLNTAGQAAGGGVGSLLGGLGLAGVVLLVVVLLVVLGRGRGVL